jgi:hypothetical protein
VFGSRSGALFDRLAATEAAASIVISAVFSTQRAERLATQRYSTANDNMNTMNINMKANKDRQRASASSADSSSASLPSLLEIMQAFTRKIIHDTSITSIMEVTQSSSAITEMSGSSPPEASSTVQYPLEARVAQAVLLNAYLTVANDPQASAMVVGQVKAHLIGVSKAIRAYRDSLMSSVDAAIMTSTWSQSEDISTRAPDLTTVGGSRRRRSESTNDTSTAYTCDFSGSSADGCYFEPEPAVMNDAFEWVSHYNMLLSAIGATTSGSGGIGGDDVRGKPFLKLLPVPLGPPI